MIALSYLDFDLRLTFANGAYRARGRDASGRHATAAFSNPLKAEELGAFQPSRTRTRHARSSETESAEALGGRLFDALFSGDLRRILDAALEDAKRQGLGLRLRLRLEESPELSGLPWEALYHTGHHRFLSLSKVTPIVRYMELPETVEALAVDGPLKVLAVLASPTGFPELDVDAEWQRLQDALADVPQVDLERLEDPTLTALRKRLRRGDVHILHFVGHGDFEEGRRQGELIFEDGSGRAHAVAAATLGNELHGHFPLRATVLNACMGARTAPGAPYAGVAQTLVRQGVPAVLAMRKEILDAAGILLAEELYSALADGYPVDACVAEARKALWSESYAEWVVPVLYLRSPDGRLFERRDEMDVKPSTDSPSGEGDAKPHPGFFPKTARGWAALAVVAASVLQGLFYGLGFLIHRSREGLAGLNESLSYTFGDTLLTGLDTLWLPRYAIFALFSPDPWLLAGSGGSLAILMAPFAAWRYLPEKRRRAAVAALLVLAWVMLIFALRFATAAVYPTRAEGKPGPEFNVGLVSGNLVDLTEFESVSWLKNDSPRNDQRRQALAGVVFWLLLAAGGSALYAWSRRELGPRRRWGLLIGHGLLAILAAGLVPRVQSIAAWGLKYPRVEVTEGCADAELLQESSQPGTCLFDVSAGGRPRKLLLWGTQRDFRTWSDEARDDCLKELERKVIGDGC